MANKRRATADSDSEDQLQDSQPAKRARTNDDDSESEPEIAQPRREKANGKGKGKATRRNDDESDDDMPQPMAGDNEEEEKLFEEKHGEAIRAALDAKRKVQGGIAEFGIIEHVEMIDFMCHKFLTFTFGPQINFIIGHNGSGKSAVLSAITVALGGKANSTGRGNGLKSFIREGQEVSEVTITMKNQGEEAYKPKEYGKSIVITRRFSKTGTSTWKIKSKDGKTVSTKKDELAAICDHMNIQVDNPMNVLTQGTQFLSASAPTDKYNFFLRGTQLSQLSEEYDTCLENIQQTSKVLNQKREAIPELKRVFKEAKVRFEEASKAREQHRKADELKKELAWSHVAAKQEEMTKRIQEVAKAANRITKVEREVEKANV
ncbi:P-loop containing nucleoside triphosphate hydrolase protein [Athelia psychrophila]|uniref:P-loop containing nucleoside triphosphate hydrolase protein n=1 Tax=Athelia psychrophila TaxID=1759441 RepID=A0A166UBH2_9AGAM|nr:P-loop containing nucleoside triphosphate hydrolase protein [Fibularhizoctonia sp. CBS 109695]